jgi:hypothetical protein
MNGHKRNKFTEFQRHAYAVRTLRRIAALAGPFLTPDDGSTRQHKQIRYGAAHGEKSAALSSLKQGRRVGLCTFHQALRDGTRFLNGTRTLAKTGH